MINSVYCPVCGAKICETTAANDLRVRCKKCKSNLVIDKDQAELKMRVLDKPLTEPPAIKIV